MNQVEKNEKDYFFKCRREEIEKFKKNYGYAWDEHKVKNGMSIMVYRHYYNPFIIDVDFKSKSHTIHLPTEDCTIEFLNELTALIERYYLGNVVHMYE